MSETPNLEASIENASSDKFETLDFDNCSSMLIENFKLKNKELQNITDTSADIEDSKKSHIKVEQSVDASVQGLKMAPIAASTASKVRGRNTAKRVSFSEHISGISLESSKGSDATSSPDVLLSKSNSDTSKKRAASKSKSNDQLKIKIARTTGTANSKEIKNLEWKITKTDSATSTTEEEMKNPFVDVKNGNSAIEKLQLDNLKLQKDCLKARRDLLELEVKIAKKVLQKMDS